MNLALLLRLALAPALVAAATLVARRYGPAAGGWAASTPVVAGPVLLVFVLDHGVTFGVRAAASATVGLVSLGIFTVVYARLALRGLPWALCLPLGWISFLAATAVLSVVTLPALAALGVALFAFAVLRRMTGPARGPADAGRRLAGDIPLRMLAAMIMVLVLGAVAGSLGATVSGLLAPFPIIGSVMAVFTHLTRGRASLQGYSEALLRGMPSFALFTATVALALRPMGPALAFTLAAAVAVASHAVLIWRDVAGSRTPGLGARP